MHSKRKLADILRYGISSLTNLLTNNVAHLSYFVITFAGKQSFEDEFKTC